MSISEVINDEHWLMEMHEKLNWYERNEVSHLVPKPHGHQVIGSKWIFCIKFDESGIIIESKVWFGFKNYNQEKGIDIEETYAHVAHLEAILLLLAFECVFLLQTL